jgi:hypothetical protein
MMGRFSFVQARLHNVLISGYDRYRKKGVERLIVGQQSWLQVCETSHDRHSISTTLSRL